MRETYIPDPHQIEAVEHLETHPRAVLALGMSLSKTAIALEYLMRMHYEEGAICKTLVIAPDKVARVGWPAEIEKWDFTEDLRYSVVAGDPVQRLAALKADAEVYIVSFDNLVWLIDLYIYQRVSSKSGEPYGDWLGSLPFDCVVIDEVDQIQGRDSNRFMKLRRALDHSNVSYRIGMTGTLLSGGLHKLWATYMLIDDGKRLGKKYGDFQSEYFTTRGNGMIVYEYRPKVNAAKIIAHKISDITLSMETRDVMELPPSHIVDLELTLAPFDLEVYNSLEEEYFMQFESGGVATVKTPANLTDKLLQISGGALYEDRVSKRDVHLWHTLNTLKIDALRDLFNQVDENFIIVYYFRHELERIKAAFPDAREFSKGAKTAQDIIDWNAGRISKLIIHPKSAGHGLNLQFGGSNMVWFTPTWNLGHWLQTLFRLIRRGAKNDIHIWRLLVKGTRDMQVRKRIYSKEDNQTFLLTTIKELRQKYGKVRQQRGR